MNDTTAPPNVLRIILIGVVVGVAVRVLRYVCGKLQCVRSAKRVHVASGTVVLLEVKGRFARILEPGDYEISPEYKPKKVAWFTSLMPPCEPTKVIKTQTFAVSCPVVVAPDAAGVSVAFAYDVLVRVVDAAKAAYASDNMLVMAELCVRQNITAMAATASLEDIQDLIRRSHGQAHFTGGLIFEFFETHGVDLTITLRTASRAQSFKTMPRRRLMRRSPER